MRHLQTALFSLFQAQMHRAQPAQGQEAVFRAGQHGHQIVGFTQPRPPGVIGWHQPHQQVRMAAEIFSPRLKREIATVFMGTKENRRRPGIVDNGGDPLFFRRLGHRRNILNLKALRAGRFQEQRGGVRAKQALNFRANQRVVIGGLNAHFGQHTGAEIAGRSINAIGHQ